MSEDLEGQQGGPVEGSEFQNVPDLSQPEGVSAVEPETSEAASEAQPETPNDIDHPHYRSSGRKKVAGGLVAGLAAVAGVVGLGIARQGGESASKIVGPAPTTEPAPERPGATVKAAVPTTETPAPTTSAPEVTSTTTQPTPTTETTPTTEVVATPETRTFDGFQIIGDQAFFDHIKAALVEMQKIAPDEYTFTKEHVGTFNTAQDNAQGVHADLEPQAWVYVAPEEFAFYSTNTGDKVTDETNRQNNLLWTISELIQENGHIRLYLESAKAHGGAAVTADWDGPMSEYKSTTEFQIPFLEKHGAPEDLKLWLHDWAAKKLVEANNIKRAGG